MSWLNSIWQRDQSSKSRLARRITRTTGQRALVLERLEDRTLLNAYTIVELQAPNGRRSYAYGLNDSNVAVGEATPQGIRYLKAASWDSAGNKTEIGVLGGNKFSVAKAVNNIGMVAGSSNYAGTPTSYHAFRYVNGGMTDLGALAGNSYGEGINVANSVAGYSNYPGGAADKYHAVVWGNNPNDISDIHPTAWGGDTSLAYDINNSGFVVGSANGSGFLAHPRPFTFNGSLYTELPLLPGYATGGEAFATNITGKVVGGTYYVGGVHETKIWHAFYWNGTTMTDLGNLGQGGDWSQALDINNGDTVVGTANTTFGDSAKHAWVWTGSGAIQDLNNLVTNGAGWVLNAATEINGSGHIAGYGTFNGKPRGFLLIPNPAPPIDPVTAQSVTPFMENAAMAVSSVVPLDRATPRPVTYVETVIATTKAMSNTSPHRPMTARALAANEEILQTDFGLCNIGPSWFLTW